MIYIAICDDIINITGEDIRHITDVLLENCDDWAIWEKFDFLAHF